MKKVLLVLFVLFVSCSEVVYVDSATGQPVPPEPVVKFKGSDGYTYTRVVIDEHDYLKYDPVGVDGYSLTHSGSCRKCAEDRE